MHALTPLFQNAKALRNDLLRVGITAKQHIRNHILCQVVGWVSAVYTLDTMKTMLNIKTDADLKKKARETASRIGLPLSAVINNYLKTFVEERQVVFSERLVPNKKTAALLRRIDKDVKAGRNLVGPFHSAEEMIKSLNS